MVLLFLFCSIGFRSEESSTSPLDPAIPRPAEHMSGHGGNFHLHGGHLEHVIGDEDSVDRPAAGMSTDELDRQQYSLTTSKFFVDSTYFSFYGVNFFFCSIGFRSEESSTSPLDPAIPRPPEHMSGHGGNFHLHGGHLEHVIGDDDIISRPPAGINSHQFDSERYVSCQQVFCRFGNSLAFSVLMKMYHIHYAIIEQRIPPLQYVTLQFHDRQNTCQDMGEISTCTVDIWNMPLAMRTFQTHRLLG